MKTRKEYVSVHHDVCSWYYTCCHVDAFCTTPSGIVIKSIRSLKGGVFEEIVELEE
jgi:hypothetical protein